MIKFSELPYNRVTVEAVSESVERTLAAFNAAKTAEEASAAIRQWFKEDSELTTDLQIAQVRYQINTKDEFYKEENDYFDENGPAMQLAQKRVTDTILDSKFRPELEKEFGNLMFRKFENQRRLLNETILSELQEENKLSSRYDDLLGGAEIPFDGKTLNLSQFEPYRQSPDRAMRKAATEAYFGWFAENQAALDQVYAKLVSVRNTIAKKLGFESGVELGYARMERFDYDENMVKTYREDVKKYLVPLVTGLRERQRKRIGVDKLYFYDSDFLFKTGNPVPLGTPEQMVEAARKMYHELSPESGEFFEFMVAGELLDLLAKPGKMTGGFCTSFPKYKAPFIFANFNGTKHDVDVLTHEAGHALQAYLSMREMENPNYWSPTYEACEIHSMSMELITRPWMEAFFGDETEKFLYQQLEDILYFIPYGCLVDDFQHHVYRNPNETPEERAAAWRSLERQYIPSIEYGDDDYLEGGRRWQRQGHIYQVPFYYIDYTLAQNCAVQFFLRFSKGDSSAWTDYLRLCKVGGSKTFVELVKLGGLNSPFKEGVLADVVSQLKAILDKTDDGKF